MPLSVNIISDIFDEKIKTFHSVKNSLPGTKNLVILPWIHYDVRRNSLKKLSYFITFLTAIIVTH